MNKKTTRVISSLLILCLLADPLFSASLTRGPKESLSSYPAAAIWQEQALSAPLVVAQRCGYVVPVAIGIVTIAALYWGMGDVSHAYEVAKRYPGFWIALSVAVGATIGERQPMNVWQNRALADRWAFLAIAPEVVLRWWYDSGFENESPVVRVVSLAQRNAKTKKIQIKDRKTFIEAWKMRKNPPLDEREARLMHVIENYLPNNLRNNQLANAAIEDKSIRKLFWVAVSMFRQLGIIRRSPLEIYFQTKFCISDPSVAFARLVDNALLYRLEQSPNYTLTAVGAELAQRHFPLNPNRRVVAKDAALPAEKTSNDMAQELVGDAVHSFFAKVREQSKDKVYTEVSRSSDNKHMAITLRQFGNPGELIAYVIFTQTKYAKNILIRAGDAPWPPVVVDVMKKYKLKGGSFVPESSDLLAYTVAWDFDAKVAAARAAGSPIDEAQLFTDLLHPAGNPKIYRGILRDALIELEIETKVLANRWFAQAAKRTLTPVEAPKKTSRKRTPIRILGILFMFLHQHDLWPGSTGKTPSLFRANAA